MKGRWKSTRRLEALFTQYKSQQCVKNKHLLTTDPIEVSNPPLQSTRLNQEFLFTFDPSFYSPRTQLSFHLSHFPYPKDNEYEQEKVPVPYLPSLAKYLLSPLVVGCDITGNLGIINISLLLNISPLKGLLLLLNPIFRSRAKTL